MNEPFYWLNKDSREFLSRGYLLDGITPEARIKQIADRAEYLLNQPGFSNKFYDYMSRGYYSLSSPIWSNFGLDRGLPISCFSSYIPDSMAGIAEANAETMMMSKYGGGTSSYWGDVRGRGADIKDNGKSDGSVSFMKLFDTAIDISKQGATRRGSHAVYQDIDHPDIEEFLTIKDEGSPIQNLFYGVCVKNSWMEDMINGDSYKRKIWARVLESRKNNGLPYIVFTDNVNANLPDCYNDLGLKVTNSNLCTEILLPVSESESFVCDLASMNVVTYDEWKTTDAVATMIAFLDATMTEFIDKAQHIPFFDKAVNFARRHRALGLGILGWHSLLQSKMIPIESRAAHDLNVEIFSYLQSETLKASQALGKKYGEPEVLKGYGRRNTTLMAIAPTTSSSFILGQVSQSIEPLRSNYYVKDLAKSKTTYRNPYLKDVLASKGIDNEATWRSILEHDGSVQHLKELDDNELSVFKTFSEISQFVLIEQAAERQEYIDQGQSLNVLIHPATPTKDINQLYIQAWSLGIKTLYYQHSINAAQEFNRDLVACVSCEA